MSSGLKYNSGKTKFIGSGLTVNTASVSASNYKGSLLYAEDGQIYYSNGDQWIQFQPPIVRRPAGISPTTTAERRKLRLTPFLPGLNYGNSVTFANAIFFVSKSSDMSNSIQINSGYYINSSGECVYDISRPVNSLGLELGDTFYWQGAYVGLYNGLLTEPSEKSRILKQVFPDNLIDTPVNITSNNAQTETLVISNYSSPFGLPSPGLYANFKIYDSSNTLLYVIQSNTSQPSVVSLADTNVNPNQLYKWSAQYVVPSIGSSFFSNTTNFTKPNSNLQIVIDTSLVDTNNFYLPLRVPGGFAATINWGDNTPVTNIVGNDATRIYFHSYSIDGTYTINVGGTVTGFGFGSEDDSWNDAGAIANSQSMIISVPSFGSSLGIANLNFALAGASNLTDITTYLPPTVIDISGLFVNATNFNSPSVKGWDTSNIVSFNNLFNGASLFMLTFQVGILPR